MKPDWKDAPEWANWLAMDADGKWYWYENNPKKRLVTWKRNGEKMQATFNVLGWEESKEKRP